MKLKKGIKTIVSKSRQFYYGVYVKKCAASVGKNLKVNHKTRVTKHKYLGNNVNFNGMKISGRGNVYK